VAKQMLAKGYSYARPLHGGLDAWNSAFAHELRRPRDEADSAVTASHG
jgi:hypothetical protein